jgi:hypothetical protein
LSIKQKKKDLFSNIPRFYDIVDKSNIEYSSNSLCIKHELSYSPNYVISYKQVFIPDPPSPSSSYFSLSLLCSSLLYPFNICDSCVVKKCLYYLFYSFIKMFIWVSGVLSPKTYEEIWMFNGFFFIE